MAEVKMARAEALRVMGDGAAAQAAGRKATACPYSPSGEPEERLRAAAWLRGYASGTRQVAAAAGGGDMTETIADPPGAEPTFGPDLPWYGILAPEGVVSGDRRKFAPGALEWRDLPLPLEWQEQTAPFHDGAYVVGRIDTIERTPDGMLSATGVWHDSEEAQKAYDLVQNKMLRGLSVEVDSATVQYEDDDGNPVNGDDWFWEMMDGGDPGPEPIEVLTGGRIAAVTLLPVPAYQEAFVANGTPADLLAYTLDHQAFAVSEKPWTDFTEADYTPEQWKDATLIHQAPAEGQDPLAKELHKLPVYEPDGSLNRAGVHAAASALAGGRGGVDATDEEKAAAAKTLVGLYQSQLEEEPPDSLVSLAGSAARPLMTLRAAAWPVASMAHFTNPNLSEPTAVRLDKDGRVYGHLAHWDTCHIGFDGTCVTPPHTASNYAYFLTGEVETDAGPVPVGQITMNTGHAEEHLSPYAAVAHYDHTGTVIADVTCGEDDIGVWFSGRVRPDADPGRVAAFVAAGSLSGDWRRIGGRLELVAALVVNTPGFPVPRLTVAASGGRQTALIASGVVSTRGWRTPNGPALDVVVAAVMERINRRDRVARLTRKVKGDPRDRRLAAIQSVNGGL